MSTSSNRFKELVKAFETLFPEWKDTVREYRSFQRDILIIIMNDGSSKIFLYKNPKDWSFGTKLYRAEPGKKKMKEEEK